MVPIILCLDPDSHSRNSDYGRDHVQLTLLNWDNESVLALNKKLKFPIHFQKCTYYLCTYVIHNIPSDSGYHSSLDK